jgi:pantetheine-phosphate adenylyltransferase
LRAISDFETEMQLAHNNRVLAPGVDTVFFMTSVEHGYVSSSLVKEIAAFGGDVSTMIPTAALVALVDRAGRR